MSRLLLFPLLLLLYLATPSNQAKPGWNAWGVPLSRGDLQYLSKILPDVLKLQEIRKEVADSRLLEPFVRRTKLYNSNQIIPEFEKHSQLLRLAKRSSMDGMDLLRLAKRGMDGMDLLRLAKRSGIDGMDLLRLAKRSGIDGMDLLRLAKRSGMDGMDLLRLAKRGMDHDNLLRLSKKEAVWRKDDNQLLRLSRSDRSLSRDTRYAEDKLLRLAKRVLNDSQDASTDSLNGFHSSTTSMEGFHGSPDNLEGFQSSADSMEGFPKRALEIFFPPQGLH